MTTEEQYDQAAKWLRQAKRIAVLTGAGVSAESGVPTFRAADGLWEGHRVEDVATPEGFERDPELVWRFYNARRQNVRAVKPNPGHDVLAELEKRWGDNFTLTTQNVDGLHRIAGNKNVLEVHGSLHATRCTACGDCCELDLLDDLEDMPKCSLCNELIRPDIVWFGEALPMDVWQQSTAAAEACDMFLVVGTSAVVFPAAGLIPLAKGQFSKKLNPAKVIEFNLIATDATAYADLSIQGPSGVSLPEVLKRI